MSILLTIAGCVVAIGLGLFFNNFYVGMAAGVVFGILIQGRSRYRRTLAKEEAAAKAREEERQRKRQERRRYKESKQAALALSDQKAAYGKKRKSGAGEADVTILQEAGPEKSIKPIEAQEAEPKEEKK
ncbi:MAG: hypothetical protein VB085_09105 [Peptococcaceae bacterium]|nr:hypothetical protein [Peptococcaceae bacterium]